MESCATNAKEGRRVAPMGPRGTNQNLGPPSPFLAKKKKIAQIARGREEKREGEREEGVYKFGSIWISNSSTLAIFFRLKADKTTKDETTMRSFFQLET